MTYRIVFMGSPDFALPTLQALVNEFPVVGVITQPDRPAGRGKQLTAPPVKTLANQLGLEVIQPMKLREPEVFARLQAWQPDLVVVAAYGQILRQNVLELPRFGCVNVHASLLPRWRGAAPIQAAILSGDPVSGVTIMKMDAGVDTGEILSQRSLPILAVDTAGSLSNGLAAVGADLLIETLPDYLAGKIQPQSQNETLATYAKMLNKEDGLLDFSQAAEHLERRVRAMQPWPGAFTFWQGQPLKVIRAHCADGKSPQAGSRGLVDNKPAVCSGSGWLVLDEVQPAGKKPMPGEVFLCGARNWMSEN